MKFLCVYYKIYFKNYTLIYYKKYVIGTDYLEELPQFDLISKL